MDSTDNVCELPTKPKPSSTTSRIHPSTRIPLSILATLAEQLSELADRFKTASASPDYVVRRKKKYILEAWEPARASTTAAKHVFETLSSEFNSDLDDPSNVLFAEAWAKATKVFTLLTAISNANTLNDATLEASADALLACSEEIREMLRPLGY